MYSLFYCSLPSWYYPSQVTKVVLLRAWFTRLVRAARQVSILRDIDDQADLLARL